MPDVDRERSFLAMPTSVSFRYFKTSPEIIQLAVMLYVRFPLSLRNVEDLLHERGVDVSYESVRYWWHRFGAQFASQIKKRRAGEMQSSNCPSSYKMGHRTGLNFGGSGSSIGLIMQPAFDVASGDTGLSVS